MLCLDSSGMKESNMLAIHHSFCISTAKDIVRTSEVPFRHYSDELFKEPAKCIPTSRTLRKKIKRVHFADDEGGVLCQVHIFENTSPYYRPHLNEHKDTSSVTLYKVVYNETRLFLKNVCVVSFGIVANSNVFGAIAVRNLAYEKTITVRFTADKWKSFRDVIAKFMQQEYDGLVDRFFFIAPLSPSELACIESNLEFAVRYSVNNTDYWDNNGDDNYSFVTKLHTSPFM